MFSSNIRFEVTPECKNLETSRNLCIFDDVWIFSENHPKGFRMFRRPSSLRLMWTACENRANFLPCIVQFDWLISDQLRYSLNIYQFDRSVSCFPIGKSSKRSTKSTCYIFLFDISKITKLMKQFWKKPRQVFLGRFGGLTGRPRDLMKNLETPGQTRRVGRYAFLRKKTQKPNVNKKQFVRCTTELTTILQQLDSFDANLILWNANLILWNANLILWNANLILWNANLILWNANLILWNANLIPWNANLRSFKESSLK